MYNQKHYPNKVLSEITTDDFIITFSLQGMEHNGWPVMTVKKRWEDKQFEFPLGWTSAEKLQKAINPVIEHWKRHFEKEMN